MIIISHRGNIDGPNKELENTVRGIMSAMDSGFDVEIDLWYDGAFFLGHDYPETEVDVGFILKNAHRLWCHAKTVDTFIELRKFNSVVCFSHDRDDCALTSNGFIWTLPGRPLCRDSIMLKFDVDGGNIPTDVYGLCTDYPAYYRNLIVG